MPKMEIFPMQKLEAETPSTLCPWLDTPEYNLADLHFHLGTSVSPTKLGNLIGEDAIKINGKVPDSRDLEELIMVSPEEPCDMPTYFRNVYHTFLDGTISGRKIVEDCTYTIFTGAWRHRIGIAELRTAPLKHNGKDGVVELDALITGMTHGLDNALVRHPKMKGGIIFCLAREWAHDGNKKDGTGKTGHQKNQITVEKAIKYMPRGVVGIDIAGLGSAEPFPVDAYVDLFQEARNSGLSVTIHSGEHPDANDIAQMLRLQPQRIGHGILAAYDEKLMGELAEQGIVLEICPSSNLATKAVRDWGEMTHIVNRLAAHGVKFTIATDWPEIIRGGSLRNQYERLYRAGVGTEVLQRAAKTGEEATFVKNAGQHLWN